MSRASAPGARVELICVGSELLGGKTNTHQSYISLALARFGLSLSRESSLPDDLEPLKSAIAEAFSRADALIVCGGLGPTFDDITREAAAAALGRPLVFKPELFAQIKRRFQRFRTRMPAENRRQAYLISGASALKNNFGSAPGQMLVTRGADTGKPRMLVLLPGPFAELSPMFERDVLPRLKRLYARGVFSRALSVHLAGMTESAADERLKILTRRHRPGEAFTILAGRGQVDFHAAATAPSAAQAAKRITGIRRLIRRAVGEHVFGEGETTLESAVGALLRRRRLTLASAESCTAGFFSGRVTAAPGSSDYFKGGVIAYSNELKMKMLGVSTETLRRRGAVSAECAREMAEGARRATGASIGLSITGIAGPSGGTKTKPVGLVYIGLAGPGAACSVWESRFLGSRHTVRERAAAAALYRLWRMLSQR
ncbi:MAG: competence/damage-inducible protein A [Elusimicrobia bacterium]|nr:competence/damage-inducible protein A [Elusimicrobiota bacterium]MDE2314752.1 competence/damage-inducible protein A [Elusimicrobiota bacterium]